MACLDKAGCLSWSCNGVELVKVVDYCGSVADSLRNGLVVRLPFCGALPLSGEEWEGELCGKLNLDLPDSKH